MLTVDVIREAGSEPADLVSVEIRAANEEAGSEPLVVAQGIVDHEGKAVLTISMGESARMWSDRDPFLYAVQVKLLRNGREIDRMARRFGLRTIRAEGKRILLNGEPVFLRGYVDCGIFRLAVTQYGTRSITVASSASRAPTASTTCACTAGRRRSLSGARMKKECSCRQSFLIGPCITKGAALTCRRRSMHF